MFTHLRRATALKWMILGSSLAAAVFWMTYWDRSAPAPSWNVTVTQDGKTIENTTITWNGNETDLHLQIRAIVNAQITNGAPPKSAEIKIWRSYSQPIERPILAAKVAKAGGHASINYTQTDSIGPVYALAGTDGYVRIYQEDNPGKPEIMAEGHQMDLEVRRSIIARVLSDRLRPAIQSDAVKPL